MTPEAHAHQLLARLQTAETVAREAMRAARFALDDMASALEYGRQLRAELAGVLGVENASSGADAPRQADPVPSVEAYCAAILGGDPCGRRR